jgi:hypothetical protein
MKVRDIIRIDIFYLRFMKKTIDISHVVQHEKSVHSLLLLLLLTFSFFLLYDDETQMK